jgi:hypothetical protein
MPPSVKVAIDRDLWSLALRELQTIHDLMDTAEIPKALDGEKLSASQRVFMYTKVMEGVRGAIEKAAGNAPH